MDPLYINAESNHPVNIVKDIPKIINQRLSNNSSNKETFNNIKPKYEIALNNSGFKTTMTYTDDNKGTNNNNKKRKRAILWYNPPYNKNTTTNLAKTFLKLIDKHFPQNNILNKIFNRNKVKVSYSCTDNMQSIINKHNNRIMNNIPNETQNQSCNCRNPNECQMENLCQTKNVIYKATVTTENNDSNNKNTNEGEKIYIGITENTWKSRYNQHKTSFKNVTYNNSTSLSTYIWKLKSEQKIPIIKWEIIGKAYPYSSKSKKCNLCMNEKFRIIYSEQSDKLLNKRNELLSNCRQQNKFILKYAKFKESTPENT